VKVIREENKEDRRAEGGETGGGGKKKKLKVRGRDVRKKGTKEVKVQEGLNTRNDEEEKQSKRKKGEEGAGNN
jgi:hypothetical protein